MIDTNMHALKEVHSYHAIDTIERQVYLNHTTTMLHHLTQGYRIDNGSLSLYH